MMVFHNRQNNITDIIPKLKINGIPIEHVKQFNFLGIIIDEHMTWNQHINKVACKITRTIYTLTRLKRFLPQSILRTLYNSLILPHLSYGILNWGFKPGRLIKLQKWAIRTINNSKYNSHTEPLFKKNKLLKLDDIYYTNVLKFYFKYKNDILPKYFHNIFQTSQHVSDITTRQRNYTILTQPNTALSRDSVRYKIPQIMLNVPACIEEKIKTHSYDGFCKYMKNHLISNYNSFCHIENCYICEQST